LSRVTRDVAIDARTDNVSEFMRLQAIDVAVMSIASVLKYMKRPSKIVVVPHANVSAFFERLGLHMLSTNKIRAEEPLLNQCAPDARNIHTFHGRHILPRFHTRSDSQGSHKDFFFAGKPIMRYSSYEEVPEHARVWHDGTANAFPNGGASRSCFGKMYRQRAIELDRKLLWEETQQAISHEHE
jgi:hypothetical protein